MHYRRLILALTAIIILAPLATALRLNDIELSEDPVDYNKKFTITAVLSSYGTNTQARFYIDDINYANKVGTAEEKEIEGIWTLDDWKKYSIKCGTHTARVELYLSGQLVDNQSIKFDIGNVPVAEYSPARPQANQDIVITLRDRDSRNPIQSADVDISHPQMTTLSKRTDSAGKIRFKPTNSGKYTLTVDERDYCGEIEFYAKKEMLVDGPRPEKPVVGEMITVAFPANSDIGIKVYNSSGDVYMIVHGNTISGAANFTVNKPGNYILALGDISTRYWGVNKSFTVHDRDVPVIDIAPDKPTRGHPMTITITSAGKPLSDAHVTIKRPDGVAKEFTSTSDGRVNYGDNTAIGVYEVRVEKERYATSTDSFTILNSLKASIEPEKPTVRDVTRFIARDQDNKLVSGAVVRVIGTGLRKLTDPEGKAEFLLNESKEYEVEVAKESYWNTTLKLTPSGVLGLTLDAREIEVGGNVTVTVTNHLCEKTPADIKITDPGNISTLTTASQHNFTVKEPGRYVINVFKANYVGNETTLKVTPHTIDFAAGISGDRLLVNVTSHGKPVEDINVSAVMGKLSQNAVTDARGVASFNVTGEGVVDITVNSGGDRYYDLETRRERIARSYRILLLLAPVSAIIVLSLVIIAVIQFWKRYKGVEKPERPHKAKRPRKPRRVKPSGMLDHGGGSRLGNV